MSEPIYRYALVRAFKATSKHPGLWFLGLLAMFLGTADAAIIVVRIFDAGSGAFSQKLGSAIGAAFAPLSLFFASAGAGSIITLLWYFFLVVAALVVAIFAMIVGQGALVVAVEKIEAGDIFKFSPSWQRGLQHFWPVIVLNAVKVITLLLLIYFVSLPAASGFIAGRSGSLLLASVFFIVVALIAMTISFLIFYAVCAVVLDKESLGRAAGTAARIFIRHWLASLEVAVTLFAVDILVIGAAVFGLYALSLPFYFLSTFFTSIGASSALFILVITFLATYALFVAWVTAVVTTFHVYVWVAVYKEFRSGALVSKILRVFYRP